MFFCFSLEFTKNYTICYIKTGAKLLLMYSIEYIVLNQYAAFC